MARRPIVIEIGGDATRALAAITATDGAMGKMIATSKLLTAATVLGGGAIATYGVKSFLDFDQAMTQSQAIMGDLSDNQMRRMEEAARSMAKQTTFSATEMGEAYFFLASAGLTANQSIVALPQVAMFAQAGMFDLSMATDLLTDAQSALGLTVDNANENLENMARVSDVLVKANTLANASVEQFSLALTTRAGPAIKFVNKDLEEGVAVLAVFADQGIKGQRAGTLLGMVFRDLQTKAIKNKGAFDEMGISVFDANGDMRNMADIVEDLEGALGHLSDEQRKAKFLELGFTDRSIVGLESLLGTSEQLREYELELRRAGGTTDEVANKQLQSFRSQLILLQSKLTDIAITIGSVLTPVLVAWATWLVDVAVPAAVGFLKSIDWTPVLTTLSAAWTTLQNLFFATVEYLKNNQHVVVGIGAVVGLMFASWAISAGLAAVATLAAAAPFILLAAAIAGVVAWFTRAYRENDLFRERIDGLVTIFKEDLLPVLEDFGIWIRDVGIPKLHQWGSEIGDWLQPKMTATSTWMETSFLPNFQRGTQVLGHWKDEFVAGSIRVSQFIMPKLELVTEWIVALSGNFMTGIAVLGHWWNSFQRGVDRIDGWIAKVNKFIDDVLQWLVDKEQAVNNAIEAPFRNAIAWIEQRWGELVALLTTPFEIPNPFEKFGDIARGAIPGFATGGSSVGGVVKVGERGPETLIVPRGSRVEPAHMSRGGGGGDVINIIGDNKTPGQIAREIAFRRGIGDGR